MAEPYYRDELVTLYHADCLMYGVGDASGLVDWLLADALVTDPPYGAGVSQGMSGGKRYGGEGYRHAPIQNDADTSVRDRVLALWGPKPALVFGSWKRPRPAGTRQLLIWDKGPASGMGDLSIPWKPNTEEIYVIGKGFRGHRDGSVLTGHRVVTWASKGRVHPNMKPVSLMAELVSKCVGSIADPFAGSGSTLLAAKQLGRQAIGVEIEERYCEIAAKRLQDQSVLAS